LPNLQAGFRELLVALGYLCHSEMSDFTCGKEC
jgi:hypothetical protein